MAVLALGAMGIGAGVAAADPGDGVNGSVGSTGGANLGPFDGGFNNGAGGGFNVGPNGIGGQAGETNTGGANLGPFGGSAGENVNGGANFGW